MPLFRRTSATEASASTGDGSGAAAPAAARAAGEAAPPGRAARGALAGAAALSARLARRLSGWGLGMGYGSGGSGYISDEIDRKVNAQEGRPQYFYIRPVFAASSPSPTNATALPAAPRAHTHAGDSSDAAAAAASQGAPCCDAGRGSKQKSPRLYAFLLRPRARALPAARQPASYQPATAALRMTGVR